MKFDSTIFYTKIRPTLGPFTQNQVDAINSLLASVEADDSIANIHWFAYMLATVKHETAHTYEPIEEYGRGKGHAYGALVSVRNAAGALVQVAYYGRGYVQLTWQANYERFGKLLDVDLAGDPALALDPKIAYQVMSIGMTKGLFTGKSLGDYMNGTTTDYVQARRIINGMDQAELIAGYAVSFENGLASALLPE